MQGTRSHLAVIAGSSLQAAADSISRDRRFAEIAKALDVPHKRKEGLRGWACCMVNDTAKDSKINWFMSNRLHVFADEGEAASCGIK